MSILSTFRSLVERFPLLAGTYRYMRETVALSRHPEQTPHGFLFCGNKDMVKGTFESEEVVLIDKLLQDSDVLIDIGANIGYYCCLSLARGRDVVAFEPLPENLQYLYKNVSANGWSDRPEIHPLALGSRTGLVELFGGGPIASLVKGWGGTSENYKVLVPVSTLDISLGERFDGKKCLIIVDVEGAEYGVLQGASHFLTMVPKPVWMVEIVVTKHMPKGITINPTLLPTFELFWQNGYEAWTINRSMRKLNLGEIVQMNQGGPKPYSGHNILFVESGKYKNAAEALLGNKETA
jgi:FkbM family methyltransferase